MRTDGERLVDRVQTGKDNDAKKQLLDNCRNAQERLAKQNSDRSDRVNKLCDRIRDTDVNAGDQWNSIKTELQQLNRELGG